MKFSKKKKNKDLKHMFEKFTEISKSIVVNVKPN